MHLFGGSILPVTDNLSTDFLLSREVFHTARIQRVGHLVHQRAMTVTFTVLRREVVLLILCDLLSLDSVPLRVDMTQLLLHLVSLLSNEVWSDQFVGTARFGILETVLLTIGKFAVLRHADRVLRQRGLEKKFAIFDANGRSSVDTLVFKTSLGSGNCVLGRRVAEVCAKRSRRSIIVLGSING